MATSVRATWWSITINNPTQDDFKALADPPTWVKRVKYQQEVGGDGTPHIQGAVNTAQVRFSAIKEWLPRAHIEVAKDKKALLKYVEKAETAVEGSQVDNKVSTFLSMKDALMLIARNYTPPDPSEEPSKTWQEDCYWEAVRKILLERPDIVQLLTNPQMMRAWKYTSSVWLTIHDQKLEVVDTANEIVASMYAENLSDDKV